MKKLIAMMVVLAVAGMANASLINLGGNFATGIGAGVYEYTDSNLVTPGVFTPAMNAYVINSSTVDGLLVAPTIDIADLAGITGAAAGSSPIFTKTAGPGQKTSLTGITVDVPDASSVYTILLDAGATAGGTGWMIVLDAPVNAGAFDPAVAYVPTVGVNEVGADIVMGTQTWVEVVPEPATIGLMGIAGLGLFLARKKTA